MTCFDNIIHFLAAPKVSPLLRHTHTGTHAGRSFLIRSLRHTLQTHVICKLSVSSGHVVDSVISNVIHYDVSSPRSTLGGAVENMIHTNIYMFFFLRTARCVGVFKFSKRLCLP